MQQSNQKPVIEIKPQPGKQELFLASPADIAIYGGAAGGGKSWSLLVDQTRHIKNPLYNCVTFRRETPQITNPGSLWDKSQALYPILGGVSNKNDLSWHFPSGAWSRFSHMQHEDDKFSWDGSELAQINWDELHHFSRTQFTYMFSRNRSLCGIKPYIRGATNPPDATSEDPWLTELAEWWIDEAGYPIYSREGKIRYFVVDDDEFYFGDTPEQAVAEAKSRSIRPEHAKSLTFIFANLYDNKILMESDPGYEANLLAMPKVERDRLLGGNWRVRAGAGMYFNREWFEVLIAHPPLVKIIRYWDLAASDVDDKNKDPDWTVGLKLGVDALGTWYVLDVVRMRESPGKVEQAMKNIATQDGNGVIIGISQDPGQAGKAQAAHLVKMLAGYSVVVHREEGDKITRAHAVSAQSEIKNIKILVGKWNNDFLNELQSFPKGKKDQVDAFANAFNVLTDGHKGSGPSMRSL